MAKREQTVLVLQGGGALGAYQAGVYEGIAETGLDPNWIAGVSIGAITATLIAGHLPERRVAHGWRRASSSTAYACSILPAEVFIVLSYEPSSSSKRVPGL